MDRRGLMSGRGLGCRSGGLRRLRQKIVSKLDYPDTGYGAHRALRCTSAPQTAAQAMLGASAIPGPNALGFECHFTIMS